MHLRCHEPEGVLRLQSDDASAAINNGRFLRIGAEDASPKMGKEVDGGLLASPRQDPKATAYWRKYADRQYRRNLTDEPLPGIWPKVNARVELAVGLYDALERRTSGVPRGFLDDLGATSIEEVDCYSVAERLLDDDCVAAIDATRPRRRTLKRGAAKA